MEISNYKVFGTDRVIDNNAQVRRSLNDEETVYCSIFGYYPKYRCNFKVRFEDRVERDKICDELYRILDSAGFSTFNMYYSNSKNGSDDYDDENDDISTDITMHSFTMFNEECLVSFGNDWGGLVIMAHESADVIRNSIDKYFASFVKPDDKVRCNIIAHDHSFYLEDFVIKVSGDLDYDLYNEGFEDINNEIVRSIKDDDNGLYILHGEAGTGKTTYIRHIIKQLKGTKKFIYVPSNLVDDLTSPKFISFILGNRNCVFVIEDCENLVVTRNNMRTSAVADMLNMTDGILADALKIKFICTFNTNEKNIDEALLRPGRCRMKYDFGKLKKERAVKAAEKLGLKIPDKDISLAELFAGGNRFAEEKKKIGF